MSDDAAPNAQNPAPPPPGLAPEPRHRGWVRYALTGGAAVFVVAMVAISLAMAGVITVTGALWVLLIGWVGGILLTYFAEPLWGVRRGQRVFVTVAVAVVLAVLLGAIGFFEMAHGAAPLITPQPKTAPFNPPAPPPQKPKPPHHHHVVPKQPSGSVNVTNSPGSIIAPSGGHNEVDW